MSGLFIGLGGTGTMTVAYVKAKLRDITKLKDDWINLIPKTVSFIDTDLATIDDS